MSTLPAAEQPRRQWRRWLYYGGIALGLGLFGWQLALAMVYVRSNAVTILAPWMLVMALVLCMLGYGIQMAGWLLVMRFLAVALPVIGAARGYFLSFLPRYIPGTVWGYLGRGEWLAQQWGVGYRRSTVGSALEATSFVLTAALFAGLMLLPASLPLIMLCLAPVVWGATWYVARRFLGGAGWGSGPLAWGLAIGALVVYLVYWLIQGAVLCAAAVAIGIPLSPAWIQAPGVTALAWVIGFLTIFVPSGMGVREVTLSVALHDQLGVPSDQAALLAILTRLAMVVAELTILAPAFFWQLRSRRDT
jgi:hypothetical protein